MQPEQPKSSQLAVMLDIETLGTHVDAPIAEIGAVVFCLDEPRDDIEGDSFHRQLDIRVDIMAGAMPDQGSITWWNEQSVDTREHVMSGELPAPRALSWFLEWLPPAIPVFSNGPHFDFVILNRALVRHGFKAIEYWRARCMKSWALGQCAQASVDYFEAHRRWKANKPPTAHCALRDAEAQIAWMRHVASLCALTHAV